MAKKRQPIIASLDKVAYKFSMEQDIVILFGGGGSERRVSVASAQHLITLLPEARSWFWAPEGPVFDIRQESLMAHEKPFEQDFVPTTPVLAASLKEALDHVAPTTTFVLALHGGQGEDGTVQTWFEERRLPFTGSSAEASAKAFDKNVAKRIIALAGGSIAPSILFAGEDLAEARPALKKMLQEAGRLVLKPVADGSSAGLFFIDTEAQLSKVEEELVQTPSVRYLAEPFLTGTELTVVTIDTSEGPRALPASEVRLERGRTFDFAGKYLGAGSQEITPAEVSTEAHTAAGALAVLAHQALGCRGYSRTDMIYTDHGPVFLELNNLPGLTRVSFIPQQLQAAGLTMAGFLADQIALARSRYACFSHSS